MKKNKFCDYLADRGRHLRMAQPASWQPTTPATFTTAFTHYGNVTPFGTASYPGFHALANEQARSRICAGIHFEFDSTAGQSIGRNVANYVFSNFMRPRICNL